MSDNHHFDMTDVPLSLALQVAFSQNPTAVAWAELPTDQKNQSPGGVWGASQAKKRLVLFWLERKDISHPLPAKLGPEAVEPFVRAWLDGADYGPQPDHDGDNGKGFRVYNEAWGHVAGDNGAFVAIEPVWLMHGK